MTSANRTLPILQGIRNQDREAWAKVVRLYGPLVRKHVISCGVVAEAVDGLVQSVFSRLNRIMERFRLRTSTDRLNFWIRDITANRVRNHFRSMEQHHTVTALPDHSERIAGQRRQSRVTHVWNADSQLSDVLHRVFKLQSCHLHADTRRIFFRVVMDGASVMSVAREFRRPETAVRAIVRQFLRCVREHFGDLPQRLRCYADGLKAAPGRPQRK